MGRLRSASAVLPALLPGALLLLLAFQAGGFYPDTWAPVAAGAALALVIRVSVVPRPFAGFSAWSAVMAGALALFGAWILLSAQWSHSPGRATVEFGRLLAYLLVLVLCASLAPWARRLDWAIRGVALAIGVICVAALITRLRPDVWSEQGILGGRLDFPITYWNALGMLAGVGGVLGLHLSASEREAWPVRVVAAALPPIAACTVYFTLSRGGIAAAAIGVVAYLLLGFSRATPAALVAIVPPTIIAVSRAYDADLLVTPDFASSAGRAQGHDVAVVLILCVVAAVWLRALALLIDKLLARVPGPGRLPVPVRAGAVLAVVVVAVVVAVAAAGPGWAHDQVDTFLSSSPAPTGPDVRDRLTVFNNNGRVDHWRVALDAFRAAPLHGSGAGTFANLWNRDRPSPFHVLDAHSLYIETLGELGLVGAALLATALLALFAGLAWRLRGPDRPAAAAVLAATLAWAVHAGVDWDWELAGVTIWLFGLAGIALARPAPPRTVPAGDEAPGAVAAGDSPATGMPRVLRLIVALALLVLALSPLTLWRSQMRLQDAVAAFHAGDCPTTIDAALDSLSAVDARADPFELIAYCDYRLGQPKLAVGAAQAAVNRDPGDWEYHYALALVTGATGGDPRTEAAAARRLNPLAPEPQQAVKAFRTGGRRAWERRAKRLPLHVE